MDVIRGEIIGPQRSLRGSCTEINGDDNVASRHVNEVSSLTDATTAADPDTVDCYIDSGRIKVSPRRADGREDTSPVGILSV